MPDTDQDTDHQTDGDPADLNIEPAAKPVEELEPKPDPATTSSDSPEPTSAKDIATSILATPEQTVAIVDLSNAVKSANNTADQVAKAETQSLEAQTGAQVANGNAVQVLVKRFEAAVFHLGQEIAEDVRAQLAKLHDAEEVVAKVFTDAGA